MLAQWLISILLNTLVFIPTLDLDWTFYVNRLKPNWLPIDPKVIPYINIILSPIFACKPITVPWVWSKTDLYTRAISHDRPLYHNSFWCVLTFYLLNYSMDITCNKDITLDLGFKVQIDERMTWKNLFKIN